MLRLLVSLILPLSAQTEELLQLTVKTAKPCLEFTRKLQDALHWRITYEDPPLLDKSQLLPVIDANGTSRNDLRVYSSTLRVSTKDHRLGIGKDRLMKDLLKDCNNNTSVARFKFTRDGDFVHVMPTHVRIASGEFIQYQPLLETPVTIRMGTYLLDNFVNEVLSQVRKSRGVVIAKGPLIMNLFLQQSVTQSATIEPARDVLVRAFREVEDRQRANGNIIRLTWYLGYSHNLDSYFFNISGAHPEEIGSEESLVKNPVR